MKQPTMTAAEALTLLKDGNSRFVNDRVEGPRRTPRDRISTAREGQKPLAAIVSCADSRVPLELVFDQGIGDLFVLRVAGNVCSPEIIGSVEYAMLHLGTPLVVVLGHSRCGAVTAAVQAAAVHHNLAPLMEKIRPAFERALDKHTGLDEPALLRETIKENVWFQIETLFRSSSATRDAVKRGGLEVTGAFYDIEHGTITWLGNHPQQAEFLS
ncbi:MAG: carbonic anhydrase [Deltaproteobacteria bacterium]|nr:carbonic anhydrase [Deltaproteobacteria bacterium]